MDKSTIPKPPKVTSEPFGTVHSKQRPVPTDADPISSTTTSLSSSISEVCRTPSYGKSLLNGIEDLFKQRLLCDFTIRVLNNSDNDVPMEENASSTPPPLPPAPPPSFSAQHPSNSFSSSVNSLVREFAVHKVVMASCSDYFRALFSVNMVESRQDDLDLHGVSASGLAPLIDYAYTGALNLCLEKNVREILGVAYFLQMTSAIDLIVDFLTRKMNFDNAEVILEMAEDYAIQKLKDHHRILILDNFFSFAETNSFLKLTASQLIEILENDSLKTSTESRLLKCVLRWYSHDPKSREREIHSVFERVRVTIDGWPTIEYAAGLDVFKRRDDCRQLVEFWVTYMTEAERRHLKQGPRTRVRSDRQSFVLIGGECYQDVFGNFHWSHPLSNEVVGNSENRYYHKDRKNWFHLGCVGYMDPISHFQFINVNDFGIFCGGYHYKYVDEIEDEDDGGNFDVPRLRRATNEARLFTPGPFGIWELSSMRESRAEFALLCLPSQSAPTHLLAIGGVNEAGILRNAEKYSIQDNRWESSAPLPLALHGLAGTTFGDSAWVGGGKSGSKIVGNLFRFDIKRKKWTEKSSMSTSRMHHTLVEWKGLLYALGGERENNEILSSVEIYDPELDQWQKGESLVFGVTQHSATVLDDRLFVLGGQNAAGELVSVIQRFDPDDGPKGTWRVLDEHLPKALKNFGVIVCTMKMPKEGEEDDKDSVHQAYDARFPDTDEESFPGDGWETVDSGSDFSDQEWNLAPQQEDEHGAPM